MNTVSYINLLDTLKRSRNIFVALVFILTQLLVPLTALTETVAADIVGTSSNPVSTEGVTPYVISSQSPGEGGNRTCEEAGDAFFGNTDYYTESSDRFDDGDQYNGTAGPITWDTDDGDTYVDWSGDHDGLAIIVKGSNEANVYTYDSTHGTFVTTDSGLAAPEQQKGPDHNPRFESPELSNLTFCWNEEVPDPDTASLTIEKEVTDGSDETEVFPFTITDEYELNDSFDLADGDSTGDKYKDRKPGTYTIEEDLSELPNWSIDDVSCEDSENEPFNFIPDNNEISVELEGDDNVTCTFTNHEEPNNPVQSFTISAHKVVCDNEELLPNWGGGTGAPGMIDENTAQGFVDENEGDCRLESDWDFQWGFEGRNQNEGVHKLPGDHTGLADGTESSCNFNCGTHTDTGEGFNDWKTFDTSTANDGVTPAEAVIDSESEFDGNGIWVREVLKEGYVPFTLPPDDTLNNESAELYCHQDVSKYDNLDLVANPQPDQTYHCVAFNAEKDDPRITVNKVTDPVEFDQDFDFTLNGDELTTLNALSNPSETFVREPGDYSLAEVEEPGWRLLEEETICTLNGDQPVNPSEISLELEDHVECTFVNERLTTITVLKDANPQSSQEFDFTIQEVSDELADAVTGRQFAENMMQQIIELPGDFYNEPFSLVDDGLSDENTWTDEVEPGRYVITEDLPIGWTLDDVTCDGLEDFNRDGSSIALSIAEHQQVECTFDNSLDDLVLELDKENDTPDPTTVGEVVTYTLTLEIPEDSGVSYNTRVVDIAPENFAVNNASAQAQLVTPSPFRTTAFAYSGNPNYASPGTWELGTLYPGDVVELTYEATILEEVTPGTYPDIAYAQGGTVPLEERNDTKYSNIDGERNADEPFVGTAVTVETEGEVLGATTLAATGAPVTWQHLAIPILLIGLAASLVRRETKGAL